MEFGGLVDLAHPHQLPFYLDLEAERADGIVIGAVEGVEGGRGCFGGPIASHQGVVEEQQNLRDDVVACYRNSAQQVVDGVVSGLANRHCICLLLPCDAVSMMVFCRFSIMKERLLAVKLMASVPCSTTKAS